MSSKEVTNNDTGATDEIGTKVPSADLRTKELQRLTEFNGNNPKDTKLVGSWVHAAAKEVLGPDLEAELLPKFRRVANGKVYEGGDALQFVGQSLIAVNKGMQWDTWNEGYHGYLSAAAYRTRVELSIEAARKMDSGNGGAVTVYTYDPEKFRTLDSRLVTERTPQEVPTVHGLARTLTSINDKLEAHVTQHNLTTKQVAALDDIAKIMGKSVKDKQVSIARFRRTKIDKKLLA